MYRLANRTFPSQLNSVLIVVSNSHSLCLLNGSFHDQFLQHCVFLHRILIGYFSNYSWKDNLFTDFMTIQSFASTFQPLPKGYAARPCVFVHEAEVIAIGERLDVRLSPLQLRQSPLPL